MIKQLLIKLIRRTYPLFTKYEIRAFVSLLSNKKIIYPNYYIEVEE